MYREIENVIDSPLVQHLPDNSGIDTRSMFKTEMDISNYQNNQNNRIIISFEEGMALKLNNGKYTKKYVSNLDTNTLNRLLKNKLLNISARRELNYHKCIRNENSSTTEEKIELSRFMINSLQDRFKNAKIDIKYIDISEFKLYIDTKDAILHNESYVYIQINLYINDIMLIDSIGFNLIYNKLSDIYKKLDNVIENFQEKITDFTYVDPYSSSTMPIILDASLAGAFIHEIYGHSLEADNMSNIKKLKIGQNIQVKDSPIIPYGTVNYMFDDEGTPSSENVLIKDGEILTLMHDKESSRSIGVNPTGNGRSESYHANILPRMTNLIINKGDRNLEESISDINNGYYAAGFMGGGHDNIYNRFSISPQLCFKIENGKIKGILKNVYIVGDINSTLNDIDGIGNKQEIKTAMCHKKDQAVMVGIVSPFLKMKKMNIICR